MRIKGDCDALRRAYTTSTGPAFTTVRYASTAPANDCFRHLIPEKEDIEPSMLHYRDVAKKVERILSLLCRKKSTTFSTKPPQFHYFFLFPAEIRNMIYKLLWESRGLVYDPCLWSNRTGGNDRYPRDFQSLIVSKTWFQEALPILMAMTRIRPTDAVVRYYEATKSGKAPAPSLRNAITMLPAIRFVSMEVGDMTVKNMENMLDAMPGLVNFELTYPFEGRLSISNVNMPVADASQSLLPSMRGIYHIRSHADDLVLAKPGNYLSTRLQANVKAWIRRNKSFTFTIRIQIICRFAQGWRTEARQVWWTKTSLNEKTMDFIAHNGDIKMRIPLLGLPV